MSDAVEVYLNAAASAAEVGNWQAAFDQLGQVVQIQGDHVGALTGMGMCMMQMGQIEQAIPYFRKVTIFAPNSVDALNNLGAAYNMCGQIQAAEDAFKRALTLDPESTATYKNLVLVYLQNVERFEDAIQTLTALYQVNPLDHETLFLFGTCYEQAGDYASAKEFYTRVVEIAPGSPDYHGALERVTAKSPGTSNKSEQLQKLAALKNLKKG